jgi:acetyl esterase/lipase
VWLLHSVLALGWTIVAPDFRVLPESNGFAVIVDVLAACHWIVTNPSKCGPTAIHADVQRTPDIVFAGASSGGWCALVAALHLCAQRHTQEKHVVSTLPQPRALLLLYPMLDLSSLRWCQPVFLAPEAISEAMIQENLASANLHIKNREISLGEPFPTSAEEMRTRMRLPLLWAILQSGSWLDYLTGVEGFTTDVARFGIEATIEKWKVDEPEGNDMKQLFPLDFADFKGLSTMVQTVVIHGTQDLEVPISDSEILVKRIGDARVDGTKTSGVKLYRVEDAGHIFDLDIDSDDVDVDTTGMEEHGEVDEGYGPILAEALRELRRAAE